MVATGAQVRQFQVGDRVGVPWLGYTCGPCRYCRPGRENLCETPKFTGYTLDGGYAEYTVADQRYCFPAARGLRRRRGRAAAVRRAHRLPLLPPGRRAVERLGIYGFGAAAHITVQVAVHQGQKVYAFTRPGDTETQEFARRLGAVWAGELRRTAPGGTGRGHHLRPGGGAGPRGPEGHRPKAASWSAAAST